MTIGKLGLMTGLLRCVGYIQVDAGRLAWQETVVCLLLLKGLGSIWFREESIRACPFDSANNQADLWVMGLMDGDQ